MRERKIGIERKRKREKEEARDMKIRKDRMEREFILYSKQPLLIFHCTSFHFFVYSM